jgi:hypothetical protein
MVSESLEENTPNAVALAKPGDPMSRIFDFSLWIALNDLRQYSASDHHRRRLAMIRRLLELVNEILALPLASASSGDPSHS